MKLATRIVETVLVLVLPASLALAQAPDVTQPGKSHELLKTFLGAWDTELTMTLDGKQTPPEKGSMTCRWLMDGRWLECETDGSMMGMPMKGAFVLGYDNFRQSYTRVAVNGFDTTMFACEGDVDPKTGALVMYGTLDEPYTGQLGKMVKSVYRFVSKDEMRFEAHDLSIGETNTEVFAIRFIRHPHE